MQKYIYMYVAVHPKEQGVHEQITSMLDMLLGSLVHATMVQDVGGIHMWGEENIYTRCHHLFCVTMLQNKKCMSTMIKKIQQKYACIDHVIF
jgi:hypothetical protein